MRSKVISEEAFYGLISNKLKYAQVQNIVKSVSGPGRSGAIAAVYASYMLGVPFIPYGQKIPDNLQPHLVIDTARLTGKTLKKAAVKMKAQVVIAVIEETKHERFWYEE